MGPAYYLHFQEKGISGYRYTHIIKKAFREIKCLRELNPSYLWSVDELQKGDTDFHLSVQLLSATRLPQITPDNRLKHISFSTIIFKCLFFCKYFWKAPFSSQHFNFVRLKMWHFQQSLSVQTQSGHVSQLLTVILQKNWISGELYSFWTRWQLAVRIKGFLLMLPYMLYICTAL